jgi:hypothetical protein
LDFSKIRVEIKKAKLSNLAIDIDSTRTLSRQQQTVEISKIDILNHNLRARKALWVAGETPISRLSYEEKKALFGGMVPELNGYEYYIGGIFELDPNAVYVAPQSEGMSSSNSIVSSFDWRSRHGANNISSPYYNKDGNGWITSVKDQIESSCGSCWAFSAIGSVEAMTNLYFNHFINPDLSEQELVSCSYNRGCDSGGWPSVAHEYIKNNGVVDEITFPYQAADINCSERGASPNEQIKIAAYNTTMPSTFENLKKGLMQSPISLGITSWHHALTLVGYKVLQVGDDIGDGEIGLTYGIILEPGDDRIGQTVWIFKNSFGTSWGAYNNGYVYMLVSAITKFDNYSQPIMPIYSKNYSDADIICADRDGDGYYYWGIGSKPATCPLSAPNDPDKDD